MHFQQEGAATVASGWLLSTIQRSITSRLRASADVISCHRKISWGHTATYVSCTSARILGRWGFSPSAQVSVGVWPLGGRDRTWLSTGLLEPEGSLEGVAACDDRGPKSRPAERCESIKKRQPRPTGTAGTVLGRAHLAPYMYGVHSLYSVLRRKDFHTKSLFEPLCSLSQRTVRGATSQLAQADTQKLTTATSGSSIWVGFLPAIDYFGFGSDNGRIDRGQGGPFNSLLQQERRGNCAEQ